MRIPDKRFLSDGFYQPKDNAERKEIILMEKPSYNDIYKKLGEYENTNVQPFEIESLRILTLRKLSGIIHFGTNVVIYEDFKEPLNIIWSGEWNRGIERRKVFVDSILNAEVTSVSIDGDYLHIGLCFLK